MCLRTSGWHFAMTCSTSRGRFLPSSGPSSAAEKYVISAGRVRALPDTSRKMSPAEYVDASNCAVSASRPMQMHVLLAASWATSFDTSNPSAAKASPNASPSARVPTGQTVSECWMICPSYTATARESLQPMSSTKPAVQPVVQSATAGEGQILTLSKPWSCNKALTTPEVTPRGTETPSTTMATLSFARYARLVTTRSPNFGLKLATRSPEDHDRTSVAEHRGAHSTRGHHSPATPRRHRQLPSSTISAIGEKALWRGNVA
mmetsp:Transcript_18643/g.70514  ORF Transcript_18643/g.70514 Transcript_18643/m.70514 type:complete len:262 (-) Transcript_18643:3-788(-)